MLARGRFGRRIWRLRCPGVYWGCILSCKSGIVVKIGSVAIEGVESEHEPERWNTDRVGAGRRGQRARRKLRGAGQRHTLPTLSRLSAASFPVRARFPTIFRPASPSLPTDIPPGQSPPIHSRSAQLRTFAVANARPATCLFGCAAQRMIGVF